LMRTSPVRCSCYASRYAQGKSGGRRNSGRRRGMRAGTRRASPAILLRLPDRRGSPIGLRPKRPDNSRSNRTPPPDAAYMCVFTQLRPSRDTAHRFNYLRQRNQCAIDMRFAKRAKDAPSLSARKRRRLQTTTPTGIPAASACHVMPDAYRHPVRRLPERQAAGMPPRRRQPAPCPCLRGQHDSAAQRQVVRTPRAHASAGSTRNRQSGTGSHRPVPSPPPVARYGPRITGRRQAVQPRRCGRSETGPHRAGTNSHAQDTVESPLGGLHRASPAREKPNIPISEH